MDKTPKWKTANAWEMQAYLKEYKDTGLSPEEVKNLAIKWQGKELNSHIQNLLRLEKEGRLVELPCKPNDIYYHRNYVTGGVELNIELHGIEPDGEYREIDACAYWE